MEKSPRFPGGNFQFLKLLKTDTIAKKDKVREAVKNDVSLLHFLTGAIAGAVSRSAT